MIAAFMVPKENPKREYIDREAVYPLAKKICDAFRLGEHSPVVMPHLILDWIDDIPAADVREVKRGKWKRGAYTDVAPKDMEFYYCSECGHRLQTWRSNFCPNCGARMEEQNEHN